MNLRLRLPLARDEAEVLAAQRELEAEDFVFAFLHRGQSFAEFVRMVEDHRHGRSLDDGWVESTWLVADVNGAVEGGHIGYVVRPNHRRRGHATEILRQSLVVARAGGVERVLVTCDDDNAGDRGPLPALGSPVGQRLTGSLLSRIGRVR